MEKLSITLVMIIGLIFSGSFLEKVYATPFTQIPESVIVITSDKKSVSDIHNIAGLLKHHGTSVNYHNLDAVSALESKWSEGLPANKQEAQKIFEKRLSIMGKHHFEIELRHAYEGIVLALRYHIDRYPAVMFDHEYVVYGVTDLGDAVKHYRTFLAHQNEMNGE